MTNMQISGAALRERGCEKDFSLCEPAVLASWIAEILSEELGRAKPEAECAFEVRVLKSGPIRIGGWASDGFPPDVNPNDLIRDRIRLRFGPAHPLCGRNVLWSVESEARAAPAVYSAACCRGADHAGARSEILASSLSSPFIGSAKRSPERVLGAFVRYVAGTLVALGLCSECKASAFAARDSDRVSLLRISLKGRNALTERQIMEEIRSWDLSVSSLFERLHLGSVSLPYAIENNLAGEPPQFGRNLCERPYFCDSWLFGKALKDPSFRLREKPAVECTEENLPLYLQNKVMAGVTAADLIRGRTLAGRAVFSTDEGSIEEVSVETELTEWIFEDEGEVELLGKVEDIWDGKAGIESLTEEECAQIVELGKALVRISIYDGAEQRVLFEGDELEHEPAEDGIEVPECRTFEERLMDGRPLVVCARSADRTALSANQHYRDRFGKDLPRWLDLCHPAEDCAEELADLSLVYGRELPEEPPCAKDRKLFRRWLDAAAAGRTREDIAREHLLERIHAVLEDTPPRKATYLQGMRYVHQMKRYRERFGEGVPRWAADLSPNRGRPVIDLAFIIGLPLPEAQEADQPGLSRKG